MRGKLLHRLRKFSSESCDSLRRKPLVDHVECDARREPLVRRAATIGLRRRKENGREKNMYYVNMIEITWADRVHASNDWQKFKCT